MTNYTKIRTHCHHTHQLSSAVIDDFLIRYAVNQDNLAREAKKKMAKYRHVARDLPESWVDMALTQYIAHRIFKEGGLINRYINHSGLDHLMDEEMSFLEHQTQHPWRFSFAEIINRPEKDFFEMRDAFTNESYLLYSTSLTEILDRQKVALCFNLIGYNGECWQSYGPISAYLGFEPEDIEFFATELNRGYWFEDDHQLMEFVEANPVPFMHLFVGSNVPITFQQDDQIVQITAEYLDDTFEADQLRKQFTIEYSGSIYKISDPDWRGFPHFSAAYYDEREELLFLNSMTDRGFRQLVKQLNASGYELSFIPDFRVNMGMLQTAKRILKKDIEMNPYDSHFNRQTQDEDSGEMENMNLMLSALIPYVNTGREPDFEEMSKAYNVPPETVQDLYRQLRGKIDG